MYGRRPLIIFIYKVRQVCLCEEGQHVDKEEQVIRSDRCVWWVSFKHLYVYER